MDLEQRKHASWQGFAWFAALLLLCLVALHGGRRLAGPAEPATTASGTAQAPNTVDIRIPADTGASGARVMFEVFLAGQSACNCHLEAALLGFAVGKLQPDRIRVVYRDLNLPETRARASRIGAAKPTGGFAINGRHSFEVPYALDKKTHRRVVDFLSLDRNWNMEDIYAALSVEYRKAYGSQLPVSPEEFLRVVTEQSTTKRAEVLL